MIVERSVQNDIEPPFIVQYIYNIHILYNPNCTESNDRYEKSLVNSSPSICQKCFFVFIINQYK